MPYIKVKILSGDVLEYIQTFSPNYGNHKSRKKKVSKSTIKQIMINEKNAINKVARKINANFGKGDIFLTLTYEGHVPKYEQAKKDLVNFLRRVKYYRKKHGMPPLKYIGTTEYQDTRAHHHIIMSAMSLDVISSLWKLGGAYITKLYSREYSGLAKYISKEPRRKSYARRWTGSRNLKAPVIEATVIKDGSRRIPEPKNYKVIEHTYSCTEDGYYHQYMKAIRIGGMDYANGWPGASGAGTLEPGAVPSVSGRATGSGKISEQGGRSRRPQVRKSKGSKSVPGIENSSEERRD